MNVSLLYKGTEHVYLIFIIGISSTTTLETSLARQNSDLKHKAAFMAYFPLFIKFSKHTCMMNHDSAFFRQSSLG